MNHRSGEPSGTPLQPEDAAGVHSAVGTVTTTGLPVRRGISGWGSWVTGVVGVALLGVAVVIALQPTATSRATATDSTSPSPPAAAQDVQQIHIALHDMAARCTAGADEAAQARIGRDVDALIGFAQRYPDARFSIDDESGYSLHLLLIARSEMHICAPAAAERANEALPSRYRLTATTPGTTTTAPHPSG